MTECLYPYHTVNSNGCFWKVDSSCNIKSFIQFNLQNFFQIVSNLLDEENKEKWEDAQQVSMEPFQNLKQNWLRNA